MTKSVGRIAAEYKRETGRSWREIAQILGRNQNTIRREGRAYLKQIGQAAETANYTECPEQCAHANPHFEQAGAQEAPDLDALFALARQSAGIINQIDPVLTHETITLDTGSPIGIIFVSCAHLGGRYTFYEGFERLFRRALDIPGLYWLSLGDDIEGFLPGFPDGSAVVEQAIADPKVQRAMLARVLDKLAERHKLLAGCASQHGGDWYRKRVGDDPIKRLYLARKVPYFDGKALVTLKVGGASYRLALAHEFPGSSIYNPNHAQRRASLFDFPHADVIVQGDKHKYAVTEMSRPPFEYDAGIVDNLMLWLVQVGTAKTGNDKYSVRGWSRGVLEWPILIFHPDRHCIEYTRDIERAAMLLEAAK